MSRLLVFLLVLGITLMAAGTIGGLVTTARAQERFTYPGECCGEYDCFNEPVAPNLVERRPEGWLLIKEQIIIPFDATRRSPDHQFRICRTEMGRGRIIIPPGRPACLWVPEAEH
ncbi:MAG: hypothetical protein O9333_14170 [Beijerinckiaceae bacterium]|jgi:hypothetical protein|nr:hypothetical protein [Beijerinckiaceae bacterium]